MAILQGDMQDELNPTVKEAVTDVKKATMQGVMQGELQHTMKREATNVNKAIILGDMQDEELSWRRLLILINPSCKVTCSKMSYSLL